MLVQYCIFKVWHETDGGPKFSYRDYIGKTMLGCLPTPAPTHSSVRTSRLASVTNRTYHTLGWFNPIATSHYIPKIQSHTVTSYFFHPPFNIMLHVTSYSEVYRQTFCNHRTFRMRTKRTASNIYHCFVTTTISGMAGGWVGGICGRPEWHTPRGGGRIL